MNGSDSPEGASASSSEQKSTTFYGGIIRVGAPPSGDEAELESVFVQEVHTQCTYALASHTDAMAALAELRALGPRHDPGARDDAFRR